MTDFEHAMRIAQDYFKKQGALEITEAYTTDKVWIFFGGIKGLVDFGGSGISIDKKTQEIKDFILPSDANFEILDEAEEIEI